MKNWIVILFLFLILNTNGQKIVQSAHYAFQNKELVYALKLYNKALNKIKSRKERQEILFYTGESYFQLHDYDNALKSYERCYSEGYDEPLLFRQMGKVLLKKGEYDDAKKFLEIYHKRNPEEKQITNLINSCNYAIKHKRNVSDIIINNEKKLNTPYAEYGLMILDRSLIFSSSRINNDSIHIYPMTGQAYNDFYETQYDTIINFWKTPVKMQGGINTLYNEGTCTFDKFSNTLYFMICNGLSGDKNTCNIYYSVVNKINNYWTNPQLLPLGNDKYNYGHPSLTSDGNKLYFVSDMPEGEGGKDIWYITKNNNDIWSVPVNAGKNINTSGDELFPYVYKDSLLYFSSDGHPGFGGLDIFYVKITNNMTDNPKNMMQPINSSADDFSICIFKQDSGLLCSNRPGGIGDDDIYSFYKNQKQYTIIGYIRDKNYNQPIENALVMLNDDKEQFDTTRSNKEGYYYFKNAKTGKQYAITVYKDGYLGELKFTGPKSSLQSNKKDTITELNFKLIPITDDVIRISDIYYDFGKWNLTEESKKELDNLVNILKVNPDINIKINSHTDDIGDEEFNQELSNYRAQSVVNTLIEKGVDPSRLSYKGWGETMPCFPNAKTDEERKMNRCTTFQIVNLDNMDMRYSPAEYKRLTENIMTEHNEETQNAMTKENRKEVVFRLQVYAGKRKLSREFRNQLELFAGRYNFIITKDRDGIYWYAIGDFKKFEQAIAMQEILRENNFNSFVTAFINELRITILEARQLSEKYLN